MFGHGVFKSTDAGATWINASQGLVSTENNHAYAIKLHPDGTLFCTVTGKRAGNVFADGGGLFRSTDQGRSWSRISPPLKWAGGFDFDPGQAGAGAQRGGAEQGEAEEGTAHGATTSG